MGFCVGDDENKQKLNFEIRSESVRFYDKFWCGEAGKIDNIEIDKKLLRRIVELCKDKKMERKNI